MRFEPYELEALAEALAPRVAEMLERRLSERPELAMSIPEAAAWARLPEYVIRDAVRDGRLPCIRVGRQIRIRRSDLSPSTATGEPRKGRATDMEELGPATERRKDRAPTLPIQVADSRAQVPQAAVELVAKLLLDAADAEDRRAVEDRNRRQERH